MLEDLKCNGDNLLVSGVQGGLDRDNKLRNNREDLGTTFLKHVTDTLDGQETVGVNLFTDSFEEDRKIMMVIELRNINFPVDLILGSVLNSDWQISAVIESTEFTWGNNARFSGSSLGLASKMFGDGSHFARVVSSNSHAFLLGAECLSSNAQFVGSNGLNGFNFSSSLDSHIFREVTEDGVHVARLEFVLIAIKVTTSVSFTDGFLEVIFSDATTGRSDFVNIQ